jgi:DNA invertase Pin-like site-specific DNA recombinase
MTPIVAYFRVSTRGQADSGLGIEAQQAAVTTYAMQHGAAVLRSFTEYESGKSNTRPQLLAALAHAKRRKATLVISKLDRLSRNLAFLANLLESKVDFVACDNPHANKLTIGILAVIAQHEAEMISARTKAALQAYKARGGKLGGQLPQCRNLTPAAIAKGRQRAIESRAKAAVDAYADLLPAIKQWRAERLTLAEIASKLTAEGHVTRNGKSWNAMQVLRVLKRAGTD